MVAYGALQLSLQIWRGGERGASAAAGAWGEPAAALRSVLHSFLMRCTAVPVTVTSALTGNGFGVTERFRTGVYSP